MNPMECIERVRAYLHIPPDALNSNQHARLFIPLISFHIMPPSRPAAHYDPLDLDMVCDY